MEQIAIVARLSDGAGDDARRLLNAGPPYDPAGAGFDRHDVYVGDGLVIFVFEGETHVEERVAALLNDPIRSAGFAVWGPLLDGAPWIAHTAYHWDRKEDIAETSLTDGSRTPT